MNHRRALSLLFATPILLALAPRADVVTFHPDSGSSASKSYEITGNLSLGDFSMFVNGQDMSAMVPMEDVEVDFSMMMDVSDEYVSVEDGKMLELVRLYESIEGSWEAPDDSGEMDELDDLVGKKVRFAWNAEDEAYEIEFHEDEGDEELLEGLGIDMDFTGLLPSGDVSEGDEWSVPAKQLATALTLGSEFEDMAFDDLASEAETEEEQMILGMVQDEILPQFEAMMEEFQGSCTYLGRRDGGIGAIRVAVDSQGSVDLVDAIVSLVEAQVPPEAGVEVSVEDASIEIGVEGEGELLWNVEAGTFAGFSMRAEVEVYIDVAIAADMQGQSQDLEASIEMLGEITWDAGPAGE